MRHSRFLSLFLSTLSFGTILLAAHPSFADGDDPPERVARLAYLQGTVSIQPAGVNNWSEASTNYPVATGDRVYTDQDGRVELQIGQTIARMWHGTDLTMTNLGDQIAQFGLAQGTMRLRTFGLDRGYQVEVDTPNGALTVEQPGDIRVDTYTGDGGTVVTVNSGAVQITGPGFSQEVGAGQSIRLVGSNPIEAASLEMAPLDEFDNFSVQRDRRIEGSRSREYVSRNTPGYDDLDDNGDWAPQTEYGPIWYPRNVPADWAPYRYGHWVWTGPWGWTWVEDESWGYAPFHYGRWVNYHDRWGWIPGPVEERPIWSPALVAFVGGPGFSVGIGIGGGGLHAWFPLGPGEPFYPSYHCSPRYVNQVNITNIHVTNIVHVQNNYYNTSNNITNINYVNRQVGITATSSGAFAGAKSVHQNLVKVTPQQLQSAQVIAHPLIRPTVQSVVVKPTNITAVPVQRPVLLTQGGREMQATAGARPTAVPFKPLAPNAMQKAQSQDANAGRPIAARPVVQPAQPAAGGARPVTQPAQNNQPGARPIISPAQPAQPNQPGIRPMPQPAQPNQAAGTRPIQPAQPAEGNQPGIRPTPQPAQPIQGSARPPYQQPMQPGQQPAQPARPVVTPPAGNQQAQPPRGLVIHNEPPAPKPTFQQQQPALIQHPGRPLEPQQIENVRQGKPAGRSVDPEFAPHATQQPQPRMERPEPAPPVQQPYRPAPQAQPQRQAPPPQVQRQAPPPAQRQVPPPQVQRQAPPPAQRQAPPPQRPPSKGEQPPR